MEKRDLNIECVGCGRLFIFMATEQDFFEKHGLEMPKRCHACRKLKREMNRATGKLQTNSINHPLRDAMEKAGVIINHNSKVL